MISGTESIGELIERKERDFLLANSRIKMKTSVENLNAGDYSIDKIAEGASVELPRWVAEELVELKLAEFLEEPFETELARALSKEKMMGPLQLSVLPPEFYIKMRRRLGVLASAAEGDAKKGDLDKLRKACYDIIGMRLSKLLSLSSLSSQGASFADKLAPEEEAFFSISQSLTKEWRAAILEGAT